MNEFMLEPSVRDNKIVASTGVKKLFTVHLQLASAIWTNDQTLLTGSCILKSRTMVMSQLGVEDGVECRES